MSLVTLSDHNTLAGALELAELPNTFLSEEVTTCFPEDDTPLHVLVWNLSEADHRDLQPLRGSVYELVGFLDERGLAHALAHPLYRMGAALGASHIERMMLLFGTWEGRNGARPRSSNELACRLAASVSPAYLEKLAERHGIAPTHAGQIALSGGSDDHGALDIATTWTEAPGRSVDAFLGAVVAGEGRLGGEHGSTVKLAHAVGALALNAYRHEADASSLPSSSRDGRPALRGARGRRDPARRDRHGSGLHGRTAPRRARASRRPRARRASGSRGAHRIAAPRGIARTPLPRLDAPPGRIARGDVEPLEAVFFGPAASTRTPRSLVYTDTFSETNGVAGTMRRLASAASAGEISLAVVTADPAVEEEPGLIWLEADWSLPVPSYERLALLFPLLTFVLARVEAEEPYIIHVATPGPIGLCGLAAAKLLGLPLVGSYHTELGPYALHLTRDAVVADAFSLYVDWFYRQCATLLAPTHAVAERLKRRGLPGAVSIWGRGVDTTLFAPDRRSEELPREAARRRRAAAALGRACLR